VQEEIKNLQEQISKAQADIASLQASIDRVDNERITAVKYANEKFAKELLPIIDALQNAQSMDIGADETASAIEQKISDCVGKFITAFKNAGIDPIDDSGKFDPNLHNAIQMVEVAGKSSGDIVQVYQKGYKYKDRILRASMVVIAK